MKYFSDALGSFRVWSVVRDARAPLPAADDTPLADAYKAFVEKG